MILPGATLGLLGGGQLGRMFTAVARTRGYEVMVLDPDPASPAAQFASEHLCADYGDTAALDRLAGRCAAVTVEFENVPAAVLERLAQRCVVRPGSRALAVCQERIAEKGFLRESGFPTARHEAVRSAADLERALDRCRHAGAAEGSRLGYDGKGQHAVNAREEAAVAFAALGERECARGKNRSRHRGFGGAGARRRRYRGAVSVSENTHRNGILDTSLVPARIPEALAGQATHGR